MNASNKFQNALSFIILVLFSRVIDGVVDGILALVLAKCRFLLPSLLCQIFHYFFPMGEFTIIVEIFQKCE